MATRPFVDWGLPTEGKSAEEVAEEAVSLPCPDPSVESLKFLILTVWSFPCVLTAIMLPWQAAYWRSSLVLFLVDPIL